MAKTKKILWLVVSSLMALSLVIASCGPAVVEEEFELFKISVNSTPHTDYGLGYPVTYKFSIPATATNLTAWQKKTLVASFAQLTTKTPDDFFNGVEAVRFDYVNDFAYVSVAFGADSDDIYLLFKDSSGDPLSGVSFVEICQYYDNRKMALVLTDDDITDEVPARWISHMAALDACQARSIWINAAIVAGPAFMSSGAWTELQAQISEGYVEAACHSMTHIYLPYDEENYYIEVVESKLKIIDELDLPAVYKKGASEYVWAWIEPGGGTKGYDATIAALLGEYKYLCDRDAAPYPYTFAAWDATNELYGRSGGIQIEDNSEAALNAYFDARYAAGEIYTVFVHAQNVSWLPGSKAINHLDYIKDKKDVWYVGFGALYMYHYVQERGEVTVESYSDSWTENSSYGR